ncbi:hypothetical protein DERF_013194 [Dermatophagoides farinae]|uniref:Uncharacterized protein n=2 Tax=Dermatophagoides farinae TaxID=6954 RepID=A0A922KW06_DERFA|nr:hypothetical protein HUG17_6167 [Dermatophagoides farinae]KAH9497189.1 hypothetical protein DERF_013194 [Dermatophagoides farinae]
MLASNLIRSDSQWLIIVLLLSILYIHHHQIECSVFKLVRKKKFLEGFLVGFLIGSEYGNQKAGSRSPPPPPPLPPPAPSPIYGGGYGSSPDFGHSGLEYRSLMSSKKYDRNYWQRMQTRPRRHRQQRSNRKTKRIKKKISRIPFYLNWLTTQQEKQYIK